MLIDFCLSEQRTKFSQREALMSRANSLKKVFRQIIEHADKFVDDQNNQPQGSSMANTSSSNNMKLVLDTAASTVESTSTKILSSRSDPSMALLQLYGPSNDESSLDPSPCPSPIPVVPSLTTNFPLLPTSPLRYPHPLQPVFFRMATPPNTQPHRPRTEAAHRVPKLAFQESLESEGDEDKDVISSLQVSFPNLAKV